MNPKGEFAAFTGATAPVAGRGRAGPALDGAGQHARQQGRPGRDGEGVRREREGRRDRQAQSSRAPTRARDRSGTGGRRRQPGPAIGRAGGREEGLRRLAAQRRRTATCRWTTVPRPSPNCGGWSRRRSRRDPGSCPATSDDEPRRERASRQEKETAPHRCLQRRCVRDRHHAADPRCQGAAPRRGRVRTGAARGTGPPVEVLCRVPDELRRDSGDVGESPPDLHARAGHRPADPVLERPVVDVHLDRAVSDIAARRVLHDAGRENGRGGLRGSWRPDLAGVPGLVASRPP